MVGKSVSPKPDPPESSAPTTYAVSTPPQIVQGAASAAAAGPVEQEKFESPGATRKSKLPARLVSLDAFRGFIMMMLAAGGFGITGFAAIKFPSAVWNVHDHALWEKLAFQFNHPDWRSSFDYFKVSFWDLIQPAFMFMVGVAMPFSDSRRAYLQQHSFCRRAIHALVRSAALVLIGVFLQSVSRTHTTWEFPNVLCQIGLGYFFAWILLNFKPTVQAAALVVILAGYWELFYFNPPPANYNYAGVFADATKGEVFEGRFAAWSKNANAAFYFDRWLLPKLRTVPDAVPPVRSAAMTLETGHWQTAVLLLPSDSESTEPGKTPPDDSPPSTRAASEISKLDPSPANVKSPESPVNDPTADKTIDSSTDAVAPPTGPGWFRRVFLSNNEPWVPNRGGYTTLNFVPSIGTTILGMLCGQLLISRRHTRWRKLSILIVSAAICLGLGILADLTVCPIVKRIWTPSWVLFSGGYVIGMLALFYLLFDIAPLKRLAFPLVVVGMNSILTYMMGQTLSGWTKNSIIKVHLSGLIESVFGPKALDSGWYAPFTLSTGVFVVFWLFLYWLHRQKIYLRL